MSAHASAPQAAERGATAWSRASSTRGDPYAPRLTASRRKWALYRAEPGFMVACARLLDELGPPVVESLRAHAVALVKPEAWLEWRFPLVQSFLARAGFEVIDVFRCELPPVTCREVWRYQWNVGPIERIELSEVLLGLGPSYGLVLRDCDPAPRTAASVRLARLKGPALPERQGPGHLRYELGAPNRIVSFVHVPDEPADIVRDLSLLLDRNALVQLLARMLEPNRRALQLDAEAFRDVARIEEGGFETPLAARDGQRRSERIGRLREAAARCARGADGCRVPRPLWRALLDAADEVAALPTCGRKRVEPVADQSW